LLGCVERVGEVAAGAIGIDADRHGVDVLFVFACAGGVTGDTTVEVGIGNAGKGAGREGRLPLLEGVGSYGDDEQGQCCGDAHVVVLIRWIDNGEKRGTRKRLKDKENAVASKRRRGVLYGS